MSKQYLLPAEIYEWLCKRCQRIVRTHRKPVTGSPPADRATIRATWEAMGRPTNMQAVAKRAGCCADSVRKALREMNLYPEPGRGRPQKQSK